MASLSKRRHVAIKLRHMISALPCSVCGVPYDVHADHILPVALGGMGTFDNLQPLCCGCNYAKSHRLSNEQLRHVIAGRGLSHFLRAVWRHDTRYENSHDRRDVAHWQRDEPTRALHAVDLYMAFLGRSA